MRIGDVSFMIGTDPEGFIYDKHKGKFVGAEGKFSGTKDNPFRIKDFFTQIDGMALEFNTTPELRFKNLHNRCMAFINWFKGVHGEMYELIFEPTVDFDDEVWDEVSFEARMLGCNPDYNAWIMMENEAPDGEEVKFRTGSGHIHLGWTKVLEGDNDHFDLCCQIVRELDATIGVASLLWDNDKRRRNLYGKAGAFRPKVYGLEYRTLSNAWVGNEGVTNYISEVIPVVLSRMLGGEEPFSTSDVIGIINQGDEKEARTWLRSNGIQTPV